MHAGGVAGGWLVLVAMAHRMAQGEARDRNEEQGATACIGARVAPEFRFKPAIASQQEESPGVKNEE